ncbi:POT family [Musa troglodytarum]|uniref:POT family n=1 Tax=Musa troglodytarum TaxID=320322 RepID=A0A9E7G9S9_9LILI|nr:POT family [Musa troglodytarum]
MHVSRFLNRAAWICHGNTRADGSIASPWSLCTVRQVEDLKAIVRVLPLWSASIFLSVSIGIQLSLSVLQALTMDRSLGPHFSIPAGSMVVSSLAATTVSLFLLDRLLLPLWCRLAGGPSTPLQRIGLGQVVNAAGMAASALVERRRAAVVHAHHAEGQPGWVVPMTALWLVLPLAVTGVGEALHFPSEVALYYQEFPLSLRSTATGMVALLIALGFYLSTAVVDLVRRATGWLPDNINGSKMENVYWLLTALTMVNYVYYVTCAMLYKYRSAPKEADGDAANEGDSKILC